MSEQSQGFTRLSYWIPAILLAMMISGFSTHYFSDDRTSRMIVPVLHWLFPSATPRMLHFMHMGIRKVAHVAEFSLFSAALFHGLRAGRNGWRFRWAAVTLVIAVTYGSSDRHLGRLTGSGTCLVVCNKEMALHATNASPSGREKAKIERGRFFPRLGNGG